MVYRDTQLDLVFGALADRTRRGILASLAASDRTISDIAAGYDMSLPAVSKHIRVFERAGLARVRRDGRVRRTQLVAKPMQVAVAWIERYRAFWESQLDMLAAYLEQAPAGAPSGAGASPSSSNTAEPWPAQHKRRKRNSSSKSAARSRRPASESSAHGPRPPSSKSGTRRRRR